MEGGLEVYDALKEVTRGLPFGSTFAVSLLDSYDLFKLSTDDLILRGYEEKLAEEVSRSLLNQRLDKLAASLGLQLSVDRSRLSLVPQQRICEAAGVLADEGQSFEEMLEELDRIRHPELYSG